MDLEKMKLKIVTAQCARMTLKPRWILKNLKLNTIVSAQCARMTRKLRAKMKPQQLLMKISLSLIRKWKKFPRKMLSKTKLTSFLNHSLISRRNTGFSKRNFKSKVVSSLKFIRN